MTTLLRDLRSAVRFLRQSPAFTIVAVLTLAMGIGASTAIFSVIYGVLIRPLAVPEARQVVEVVLKYQGELSEDAFTYQQFRYLQDHSQWPAAIAAFTHVGLNLSSDTGTQRISALHVSSDYFSALGARPLLGREFSREEDRDPSARVAILSHALWAQQFASDPAVVGRAIHLDGSAYRVIGVMPPAVADVQLDLVPPAFGDLQRIDLWTTLAPVADTVGSGENLEVVARVKPGTSLQQAGAQLDALTASFQEDQLEGEGRKQVLGLSSVQSVLGAEISTYLWILLGAVSFVLLIACANISNLLLARASGRTKEVALRSALGADRGTLVRQFLSESLLLAAVGGVAGLLVAQVVAAGLVRFAPIQLPRATEIRVDGWAFLFTLIVTVVSGALAGIVPALQASKTDVSAMLKENAAQSSSSRRSGRFREALVVSEFALSLMLLVGAALLGQSFLSLLQVNPGFQKNGLLSAEIWLTGTRIHSTAELTSFCNELTRRLKQLPGVQDAAIVSSGQPLERGGNIGITVNGSPSESTDFRVITPEYFRTLGVAMQRGRDFEAYDGEGSEPVAIVNEAFVRKVLKGSDPFTSTVKLEGGDAGRRIVGVVANVKPFVGNSVPPTVFLPSAQTKFSLLLGYDVWFPTHVLVRTAGDPLALSASVDKTIRSTDSSIPVGHLLSMEQILSRSLAAQRFMMTVVAVFAVLALALASVGIYGLIAFSVSQRTHELGIRMALGADATSVVRMVLREGTRLAALGTAIGLAGAFALGRAMGSALFGVQPGDWRIMVVAAICLLLVAFFACYLPARRATKVDPMVALRYE
ncbi:MAG TPA: ABC transporter permease [Candidatus Acidoferrum sp.]